MNLTKHIIENKIYELKIYYKNNIFNEYEELMRYITDLITNHNIKNDKKIVVNYSSPIKNVITSIIFLSYGYSVYLGSTNNLILEYMKSYSDYILYDLNDYNRISTCEKNDSCKNNTTSMIMLAYLDMSGKYNTDQMEFELYINQINSIDHLLDLSQFDNIIISPNTTMVDVLFWIMVGIFYNKTIYFDCHLQLSGITLDRTLSIIKLEDVYMDLFNKDIKNVVISGHYISDDYITKLEQMQINAYYQYRLYGMQHLIGCFNNHILKFDCKNNNQFKDMFDERYDQIFTYVNSNENSYIKTKSNDIFKQSGTELELVVSEENALEYNKNLYYLRGIELILEQNIAIDQAAIKIVYKENSIMSIVYYISTGYDLDSNAINTHLAGFIPVALLPKKYIKITELPFDSFGVLLREKLPEAFENEPQSNLKHYESDPITSKIINMIQESCTPDFSIQQIFDSFYDLGVNSLMFVELAVAIEEEFDIEFSDEMLDVELFENVAALIDYIKSRAQQDDSL